jgi:hypothetical protein
MHNGDKSLIFQFIEAFFASRTKNARIFFLNLNSRKAKKKNVKEKTKIMDDGEKESSEINSRSSEITKSAIVFVIP